MNPEEIQSFLEQVKFNAHGLAPCIVQDADGGRVLMFAFTNREALERSLESGLMHYFSRSRQAIWKKGESSGHVQRIREIRLDCDGDCILVNVDQNVGACHMGYRSCFFRRLAQDGSLKIDEPKVFDEENVYK